jgi:hypothetical protein
MSGMHDANSDAELDRLRERLAYYESFDQLIQKSVGDAGTILREAIELRERTARESAEAAESAQAIRAAQVESFRSLYSGLLDDVTALQGTAERLARRLTDAIDALEAELHPDVAFPALPNSLTPELASRIDEPALEDAIPVSEPVSLPEPQVAEEEKPLIAEPVSSSTGSDLPIDSEPGRFVLLVHGVPNAATALSLKSYLDDLSFVSRVEPREFAAGVLRLQVMLDRALQREDLLAWDGGRELAVVLSRPGLLEVKLSE